MNEVKDETQKQLNEWKSKNN
ncbi:hypothetical protein [Clostridium sp.]